MNIFQKYSPPKHLPELAPSRVKLLERLIRIIEGNPGQHVGVVGKPGSGRSTLIHHLLALGPSFRRAHRFTLDVPAAIAALYEPSDTTPLFLELRQFTARHPRALILLDNPSLLLDTADKTEERRLIRFLKELSERSDLRLTFPLDEQSAIRLRANSSSLQGQLSLLTLESLSKDEVLSIINKQSVPHSDELFVLAQRFLHQEGAPGNVLGLWRASNQIALQQQKPFSPIHAHQYISEVRGLPMEAVSGSVTKQLRTLREDLGRELIGQQHAIDTVSRVLTRSYAGFRNESKPVASFLFLGPSGVGKTELAKILSRTLYQDQKAFHRIDMSEFSESHTVQRLIGSPPGYVGFEEGGQLTNPVDQEPYSLVLLDEIEKAHPKVFDVFLQLLDDGRLTDGRGKTVDFTHTTIVATSNIGLREIVEGSESGLIRDHERFLNTSLLPLLLTHFRPEFLNRFDAIIVFNPLSERILYTIGEREISKLKQKLMSKNISLTVRSETLESLSKKAYQPTFGARPMKRLIEETIESVVAERIVTGQLNSGDSLSF